MRTLNSFTEDFPYKLYTDGGVIGKNPSPIGGTWACVLTFNNELCWQWAGRLRIPGNVVTNNQTELHAIIRGLSYLPHDSIVQVCSDSQISLHRVFDENPSMDNIPQWMQDRLIEQKHRLIHWNKFGYQLLNGHPTKIQLERGIGNRGYPVSKWNVLCDKLCNEAKG